MWPLPATIGPIIELTKENPELTAAASKLHQNLLHFFELPLNMGSGNCGEFTDDVPSLLTCFGELVHLLSDVGSDVGVITHNGFFASIN
ncbi:unnamed protein product [Onchocerca ochengi]|uniref:Phosphoglycerate mutase n=1 Tax=Onchocerca ochengi TaxID=42157 RepID=A0A182EC34_ONCOC|nr:unnamed protein product [Onchocerca ochengi]